jgi:DNA-directed RNA polymerase sigma subunit (sigma70/sigma32)
MFQPFTAAFWSSLKRERVILIEYYGLEGDALTLKQIALRHNITREQARALKARAEWRIRRRINATLVL